ncbi:MAG: phage tail sheath subtilisin-like domain-containing protein [Blastocatellia bacterium]
MTSPSLVIENTLPGVTALVNQAQVARPIVRQPTSTGFIVAYTPWGPVNIPRIVTSWNDNARQFGGFDANSFGDDFAHVFFNLFPGRQAWICRVVGDAAAKATATIKDQAAAGVAQVETATVIGTIGVAGAGNAKATVTGVGIAGSPLITLVAVANSDSNTVVAGKIRTALSGVAAITSLYAVGGAGANITLTRITPAANDDSLNLAIDNDTCTGLTAAPTSTNTTTGHAAEANTLRIDAKYPSSRVDILYTISAGTQAETVKLTFRSVFLNRKETFDNFKMDAASIDNVNQKSKLVDLTNLNSANAAPLNLPKITVQTALTGGDDDFAGLSAADYIGTDDGTTKTGLQVFNNEYLGTGQVLIPGITGETVRAALDAHAEKFHRAALHDPPLGSDKQDLLDIREEMGSWYSAMYWPWVEMLDFEGTGLTKFYPPSIFAAGACAKADREVGTHKAPANYKIPTAIGVEKASNGQDQTDENTRELLNGKDINVITPLPEQGVKIYGARVMTGDRRVQMIHEIRMLNLLYYSGKIGYQWAVFQTVDPQGRLFRDLRDSGIAFLKPYWEVGALFGVTQDEAFIVIADFTNNPLEELQAQRVHVQWGVKLSPTAEIVILNIDNVPLFQDLSVLQQ